MKSIFGNYSEIIAKNAFFFCLKIWDTMLLFPQQ